MNHQYKTVKSKGCHEIIIERSRFICYTMEAKSEDIALNFINEKKKLHWDANHNCSAYMIGPLNQIQRAHDDGEPSGTAGVPMLDILKKLDLKDTVLVVTRYFGGIKLGTGGLIRAYARAAKEGLVHAGIVERTLMNVVRTSIDYTYLGKIERALPGSPYILKEIHYGETVEMDCFVNPGHSALFADFMTDLTNGTCLCHHLDTQYIEKDIIL